MIEPRCMSELEQLTWDFLREHHVGRTRAIPQLDLGIAVGIEGSTTTITRRVQTITKALRDEFGLPVCASSRTITDDDGNVVAGPGVYIPERLEEAEESVQNMLSRGWETVRSGRKLSAAVLRFCGGQRPLAGMERMGACTDALRAGEAGFCSWCGDLFTAARDRQEFCTTKSPLCRDLFWAEARRLGAETLRRARRAS